jgi:hypothetical protein
MFSSAVFLKGPLLEINFSLAGRSTAAGVRAALNALASSSDEASSNLAVALVVQSRTELADRGAWVPASDDLLATAQDPAPSHDYARARLLERAYRGLYLKTIDGETTQYSLKLAKPVGPGDTLKAVGSFAILPLYGAAAIASILVATGVI